MALELVQKNKKKKNEETKPIFEVAYPSGTHEAISLKFGMWSTEVGGSVTAKSSCFVKAIQSYGGAKIAFSFFLSIYSRVLHAGFLGRTTHYRVS